ncbi:MAG: hypothetical protein U0R17_07175 [Acidimicrobiia bacterium]
MAQTNVKRTSRRTEQDRSAVRNRIRDARLALSEPAHVIADRARSRYEKAEQHLRIPSRKPRIVKAQPKNDRVVIWAMRFFALGIVVSLFAVVSIQTTIAKRQISIDAIRNQQQKEITKFEKLRYDVAGLKSPERITRRASYLGLVQPTRFVSVSIPMEVSTRQDQKDSQLWSEVKAIVNASS